MSDCVLRSHRFRLHPPSPPLCCLSFVVVFLGCAAVLFPLLLVSRCLVLPSLRLDRGPGGLFQRRPLGEFAKTAGQGPGSASKNRPEWTLRAGAWAGQVLDRVQQEGVSRGTRMRSTPRGVGQSAHGLYGRPLSNSCDIGVLPCCQHVLHQIILPGAAVAATEDSLRKEADRTRALPQACQLDARPCSHRASA